jgi:centractin
MQNGSDLQKTMLSNIILAGGSTLFQGFAERLYLELKALEDSNEVQMFFHPSRNNSAWIGGSIL